MDETKSHLATQWKFSHEARQAASHWIESLSSIVLTLVLTFPLVSSIFVLHA